MPDFKTVQIIREEHGVRTTHVIIVDDQTDALYIPACQWLYRLHRTGKAKTTTTTYAPILTQFLNEAFNYFKVEDIQDITDEQMSVYLQDILLTERKISPSTFSSHLSVIKNFYDFLFTQGISDAPPYTYFISAEKQYEIDKASARKKSIDPYHLHYQYLPKTEFEELLSYNPRSPKNLWHRDRDEIVLKLGYLCGLRAEEVVSPENVSIENFNTAISDPDNKGRQDILMRIIGKGNKVRTILLPKELVRSIQRHIKNTTLKKITSKLFVSSAKGNKLSNSFASDLFRSSKNKLILEAPLDVESRWINKDKRSFHSLRHSYATNLAYHVWGSRKYPRNIVKERLGHSKYTTTLIYLHFSAKLHQEIELQNQYFEEFDTSKEGIDKEDL